MKRSIDISGLTFGKLTALRPIGARNGEQYWDCACACGRSAEVKGTHLRAGRTASCGCAQVEASSKHGMYKSTEHSIWRGMIQRCHNPKSPRYKLYGGNGIAVAEEWRKDFAAFYAHIGPRPSPRHSVDRIETSKGYEPGNVRWATQTEQCRNRRNNVRYALNGLNLTLPEWSEHLGLLEITLRKRLSYGWPIEDVFNPLKHFRRSRCSTP